MTEEQKQALANDLTAYIGQPLNNPMTRIQWMEVARIALASLTAQPIGRVDRGEVSDTNEYPNARVVCLHDQADWENFPDGTELFLRPAPVISMDKPEPYAWLVRAPQGGYVERNPEVVAHLEGTGLTKCKPLYLDL